MHFNFLSIDSAEKLDRQQEARVSATQDSGVRANLHNTPSKRLKPNTVCAATHHRKAMEKRQTDEQTTTTKSRAGKGKHQQICLPTSADPEDYNVDTHVPVDVAQPSYSLNTAPLSYDPLPVARALPSSAAPRPIPSLPPLPSTSTLFSGYHPPYAPPSHTGWPLPHPISSSYHPPLPSGSDGGQSGSTASCTAASQMHDLGHNYAASRANQVQNPPNSYFSEHRATTWPTIPGDFGFVQGWQDFSRAR